VISFFAAAAVLICPGMAQQPKRSLPAGQTIYTMRGEYEVQPQGDGKNFLLRRLANGAPYEVIAVTRISETRGEMQYVDQNGKQYTVLADGRLAEEIAFAAFSPAAASSATSDDAVPRLMDAPPVLPRSVGVTPTRLGNVALPAGENAVRSANGLIFLTTHVDGAGKHREVIVQEVAHRWYIRTSVSDDESEAPVFRLEEDGSVSGYSQLPAGMPQVSVINRSVDNAKASVPAGFTGAVPVARVDEKDGHAYLRLDGDSEPIELESVRGSTVLFTPRGKEDVLVLVDGRGKVTVTDLKGQPVNLGNVPLPGVAVSSAATDSSQTVDYQGIGGRITTRSDATGRHMDLTLDGEPGAIELEPVRGNAALLTPRRTDSILVIVGSQGKLTVSDSQGKPVSLSELRASQEVTTSEAHAAQEPINAAHASPPVGYTGPMSGTLECDGSPVPQNGEYVFSNLPAAKLNLAYDQSTWEVHTVQSGQTQRLIIRNKKPGTQKKCAIHWKVLQ
jgi:hypothetical protein